MSHAQADRQQTIIDCLEDAFSALMERDPRAFRVKFRKMAADPFAFYRGSAALFYADVGAEEDRWADDRTARVWIHGDLHAENFGTVMNSHGELVFDVNDFDEAYIGHFSWDLRRFLASLALIGWRKALPAEDVEELGREYLQAYLDQVRRYVRGENDSEFALRLDNAEGMVREILKDARGSSRTALLDALTLVEDDQRRFRIGGKQRRLDPAERQKVEAAYEQYLQTVPEEKKRRRPGFYRIKDVVGVSGIGIGSAGLSAYTILAEGPDEALENDILLSMKQGNVPAVSRLSEVRAVEEQFEHQGHRTAVSQLALQVHADPYLGWTTLDGVGHVVDELSPYELDLEWEDLTEPEDMAPVVRQLGQATAKVHSVSDQHSSQPLVAFQVEEAVEHVVGDRDEEFVRDLIDWAMAYGRQVRADHESFVDAFRRGLIGGVDATARSRS